MNFKKTENWWKRYAHDFPRKPPPDYCPPEIKNQSRTLKVLPPVSA
jgi:hypothetical protein